MNRLIFIRNVFIMFLICFSVFSNSHAYASISINDYIMEEIGDNTEHPFLTIPIKLGHYIDFDFKITKHIILVTVAGI